MAKTLPTDDYKGEVNPQSRDHLLPALVPDPRRQKLSLDYYVKARSGNKRNYIFNVSKALKCSHPELTALSIGEGWYRCRECNFAYYIVAGKAVPLHLLAVGSAYNLLHFAKEFGGNALQEVLRQPHGQFDSTPHKAVLPEGMTFSEAIFALEGIDVNAPDHGKAQLAGLLDSTWVSDRERERKRRELTGQAVPGGIDIGPSREELAAGSNPPALGEGPKRKRSRRRRGAVLPPVQAAPVQSSP